MEILQPNSLAASLLKQALARRASDMHLEPGAEILRVRIRVDGILEELCCLPLVQHSTLVTQLKVASGMDIAEKRVPQDSRLSFNYDGQAVDVRLATLPTISGEKLALRFLVRDAALLSLDNLSFSKHNLACWRKLMQQPNGLVLLTGPTGSGKTTTLYAALGELDARSLNIVTLEDPVEYQLPGINQIAVNRKAGLDFATGLRALVRQDPDVIMLGEIRDEETAAMAVHAALTGHLVLSTLHTNDALGAVYRLLDMGIADYLLAAALRGVLAQRLVRRLCPACAKQKLASEPELRYLGRKQGEQLLLKEAAGCEHCHNTGYNGRLAVQELLPWTKDLAQQMLRGAGEAELLPYAREAGWRSLYQDGISKVLDGLTTVSELWRQGIMSGGEGDV